MKAKPNSDLNPSGWVLGFGLLGFLLLCPFTLAEEPSALSNPRPSAWAPADTTRRASPSFTKPIQGKPSTTPKTDQKAAPGTAPAPNLSSPAQESESKILVKDSIAQSRADTVQVVKHHYSHRHQIIASGAIMAALIASVAIMNNYNPR
jgi:hypothetical protein